MNHFVESAKQSDINALLALEQRIFVPADGKLSRRAFSYHLGTQNLLLVARPESESSVISGYILVFVRKRSARIYSLASAPEFRQQGVAKALLNACFVALRVREIGLVTLEVRASNRQAKALYLSLGFTAWRTRANYYGDGETAICMQCAAHGIHR